MRPTSFKKHLNDQNWLAVTLDFFVVLLGILIAFQITNWNERRQADTREKAVLLELEEEFTEIRNSISEQNTLRKGYVGAFGQLIVTLKGSGLAADHKTIVEALNGARSTGRLPAQSAAYVQLMASSGLVTLSNPDLQKALVRYDKRLQREAFIFPELMKVVTAEISTNTFVNLDFSLVKESSGRVDKTEGEYRNMTIRSYDLEGLKSFVNRYEAMYLMHLALLESDTRQLELANEILRHIAEDKTE